MQDGCGILGSQVVQLAEADVSLAVVAAEGAQEVEVAVEAVRVVDLFEADYVNIAEKQMPFLVGGALGLGGGLQPLEGEIVHAGAGKTKGGNMYEDETIEEELVIKRIEGTKTEFSLLQFNITASAILFKEI